MFPGAWDDARIEQYETKESQVVWHTEFSSRTIVTQRS